MRENIPAADKGIPAVPSPHLLGICDLSIKLLKLSLDLRHKLLKLIHALCGIRFFVELLDNILKAGHVLLVGLMPAEGERLDETKPEAFRSLDQTLLKRDDKNSTTSTSENSKSLSVSIPPWGYSPLTRWSPSHLQRADVHRNQAEGYHWLTLVSDRVNQL